LDNGAARKISLKPQPKHVPGALCSLFLPEKLQRKKNYDTNIVDANKTPVKILEAKKNAKLA